MVFLYIWAGPHHLHYTALPEWASTLGMIFSIMLWMPSWGGMLNGLLTLRGAWHKLRDEPVLKFFVIGLTFYGMSTFEGPMLSVKAVNALSHYTDWNIAHVHSGALGWNGFMTFGMIYWLIPRLWKTKLYSVKLANTHFWLGTVGILLYVISMYSSGVTQGLMWRAFDETGRLLYPDFIETVVKIIPMYWVRLIGGTMYLVGVLLKVYNLIKSVANAPKNLEDPEVEVPPMVNAASKAAKATTYDEALNNLETEAKGGWHRLLESLPMVFTVLTVISISIGGLVEIVPMLLVESNIPTISSVKPYTALEIEGRDIYIKEGCVGCHSQMIRPFRQEIERYGEYSKPGEGVYDHPFLWGSKRTGPDLARVGGKYPHLWHVRHMEDPLSTSPQSIMPKYDWLLSKELDLSDTTAKLEVMAMLGVPYSIEEIDTAPDMATKQAAEIAAEIQAQGGPADLQDKEITALVAYLQRLGADLKRERDTNGKSASAQR